MFTKRKKKKSGQPSVRDTIEAIFTPSRDLYKKSNRVLLITCFQEFEILGFEFSKML